MRTEPILAAKWFKQRSPKKNVLKVKLVSLMHLSKSNIKMTDYLLMEDFIWNCYTLKLNTSSKENIYVTLLTTLKGTKHNRNRVHRKKFKFLKSNYIANRSLKVVCHFSCPELYFKLSTQALNYKNMLFFGRLIR